MQHTKPPPTPPPTPFDLLQRAAIILRGIGGHAEHVWEAGKTFDDLDERLAFLAKAIDWLSVKMKETIWRVPPVNFTTFCTAPRLLNKAGILWPKVLEAGEEINSGKYTETLLTGAIGVAKTTLALYTQAYQLYTMSCLRNAHEMFDLDPSSEILIVFQSINKNLAKDVDYRRFRDMIEKGPYFATEFPFNDGRESDMQFPRNFIVKPVAGGDTAAIGQNVIGGIIDECLVAGTLISTPTGERRIEELIPGDVVLGFDGVIVPDHVKAARCTGKKAVFDLLLDDGTILRGTSNHPVLASRGWVGLASLECGEEVRVARSEVPRSLRSLERASVSEAGAKAASRSHGKNIGGEGSQTSTSTNARGESPFSGRASAAHECLGPIYKFDARDALETHCFQHQEARGWLPYAGGSRCNREAEGKASRSEMAGGGQVQDVRLQDEVAAGQSFWCPDTRELGEVRNRPDRGTVFLRSPDHQTDGRRRGSSIVSLRTLASTLRQRENYDPRLHRHSEMGREGSAGDEVVLRSVPIEREDGRREGVGEEAGNALCRTDRARVVRITFAGEAPVYNIETDRTHTYVANSVVVHNCNFMAVVEDSKMTKDGSTYDQAMQNYSSIARRRESRFMQMGQLPGMLCLVSSRNYPGQFSDHVEERAKTDPHIYVYDKRLWEIRPERFSGETFRVFVGDESRKPRVLDDAEDVAPQDDRLVWAVPVEYRQKFQDQTLGMIRDVLGLSTMALFPFMINADAVSKCFGKVEPISSLETCDFVFTKPTLYPKRMQNPEEPRFCHIDLALSKDSAGVSVGHVPRFVQVDRGDFKELLPVIQFDLILEVEPPKGGEIEFSKIRELIYFLRNRLNMPIKWVTFDQYQSNDSRQIMQREGFATGYCSMDVDTLPYEMTKQAFYDDRIIAPKHKRALKEMLGLEFDPKKQKIDHPPHGSKDVSDSMAGVVVGLMKQRLTWVRHKIPTNTIPSYLITKAKNDVEERQKRLAKLSYINRLRAEKGLVTLDDEA